MIIIIIFIFSIFYLFISGFIFARQMERKLVCLPPLARVAVCGGTHGNELSGVHVVRELLKGKRSKRVDDGDGDVVSVTSVLTNPRAVQQGRRYTDADLNRCFTRATLR